MPNYYTPFQGNPYMNKIDENQFNNWRGQYYGNNGYRPQQQQNRLSDLVYRPQNFSYTNANFQQQPAQQQYYQQNYQAPQTYQQPEQQSYRPRDRNVNYYIEYNGNLIPSSDYVRMENERTQGKRY